MLHNISKKSLVLLFMSNIYAKDIINKIELVESHNILRKNVNVSPVHWANDLEQDAKKWAKFLAEKNSCNMMHGSQKERKNSGENLFWGSAIMWSNGNREVQKISNSSVVESWGSENQFYNYKNNSCQAGEMCGHYTQIVWDSTKEIGCGMEICSDLSQIWVCRYRPAGNIIGKRPY
jgi:pathogenesis-related protein 1